MTNGDISELRLNLTETQRALLEKRLRGKSTSQSQSQIIPRRTLQKEAPLSFGQQRLWFLQQSQPEAASYNIIAGLRLIGILHVRALEKSLTEIVRRHEVLRTTFKLKEGERVQVIGAPEAIKLQIVDLLNECEQANREERGLALLAEEVMRPFDLARGPLFKPMLVRLNYLDHMLLLTWHHIVFDGWSA